MPLQRSPEHPDEIIGTTDRQALQNETRSETRKITAPDSEADPSPEPPREAEERSDFTPETEILPPRFEENELLQFTGAENYYPSSFGTLNLTDGAHYLRERAGCYWLIDIIESYQPQLKGEEFQIWGIIVNDDKSAIVYCKRDCDQPSLIEQHIEYTDFPLKQYELYCTNGVILLKSEY